MASRKRKHLPHGAFRVIRLSQDAVREFVYESILDKGEEFFDLLSTVNMPFEMEWDESTGDFIIAIHDGRDDITIDMEKAKKEIDYTTDSLLSPRQPYYRTVVVSSDGEYEAL